MSVKVSTDFHLTELDKFTGGPLDKLTIHEMQEYLQDQVSPLQFGDVLADMLWPLDTRMIQPVIACAGGDLGQLMVALAAYEEMVPGDVFSTDFVQDFLQYHLAHSSKSISLVTDVATLSRVCQRGKFCPVGDMDLNEKVEKIKQVLSSPADSFKDDLDLLMVDPSSHIGFLGHVLRDPSSFLIREGLARAVINGFFHLMWSDLSPRLSIIVLPGAAVPQQSVVRVHAVDNCPTSYGVALTPRVNMYGRPCNIVIQHVEQCSAYTDFVLSHLAAFIAHSDHPQDNPIMLGPNVDESLRDFRTWGEMTFGVKGGKMAGITTVARRLQSHHTNLMLRLLPNSNVFELTMDSGNCLLPGGMAVPRT